MHIRRHAFNIVSSVCMFLFVLGFTVLPSVQAQDIKAPACDTSLWICPSITKLGEDSGHNATLRLTAANVPTTDPVSGVPISWNIACGYDHPTDGQLFTTGNVATDKQYCLGDSLERMSTPLFTDFAGGKHPRWEMELKAGTTNPMTTSDGNLTATIKISATEPHNVTCFFVAQTTPKVIGSDGGQNVAAGSKDTDSLKYASFSFQGTVAACTSVRDDPFGRVFNASTLKPVPGAVVTLSDFATKSLYKLAGVPNPVITKEDGMFNFNIEPGTTFLSTGLLNFDVTKVHPNAALAYSNIYTYGDPIVETAGKPEQRDIPVQNGQQPVLKLMGFSHLQLGDSTRIEGRASWPLTQVNVMQGNVSIAQQNADKFGGFSFFIDNGSIDASQQLRIVLTEVDMLLATPTVPTNPKTIEKVFDPIARYVEGFAYDKAGKVMPFATVRVVLDTSEAVYHELKADDKGFYSVGPKFLPILPFHLEYSPANSVPTVGNTIKVTLPEFVKKNKEYHDANLINPMKGTKNGVKIDPNAVAKNRMSTQPFDDTKTNPSGSNPTNGNNGGYNKVANGAGNSPLENLALATGQSSSTLLVILIILFIVVAATLVMYIRNQRNNPMSPQSPDEEDSEPEEVV